MRKRWKVLLVAVSGFLVLFFVAGTVVGNVFYDLALNPHSDKSKVVDNPKNELDLGEDPWAKYDEDRAWFDESGYYRAETQSFDGLTLSAFVVENPAHPDNWVFVLHGYNSASWLMVSWAHAFYDMGFSVIMPDARGCGRSEGDFFGMGWYDRLDLLDWIDGVNENFAPQNIVLFGISMGGATVMMASGEELPQNVRAIVEDCGYTNAKDEFAFQLKQLFGLPAFPIMNFTETVARVRAGYWLAEADAVKQVAKSQTPTLFIHGEKDTFVPAAMVDEVYAAASCPKEKLVVADAGHGGSASKDEALYWDTIRAFVMPLLAG
ncbi:alpha/beta hydrolase [Clostridia bacterium OttesenSCG-928-O13]|nr:alpha/beta hydrolase [Clostridia bacterium OttesenSCG-928-O13]